MKTTHNGSLQYLFECLRLRHSYIVYSGSGTLSSRIGAIGSVQVQFYRGLLSLSKAIIHYLHCLHTIYSIMSSPLFLSAMTFLSSYVTG